MPEVVAKEVEHSVGSELLSGLVMGCSHRRFWRIVIRNLVFHCSWMPWPKQLIIGN